MKRIRHRQNKDLRFEAALCGVNLQEANQPLERLKLTADQEEKLNRVMQDAIARKKQEFARG